MKVNIALIDDIEPVEVKEKKKKEKVKEKKPEEKPAETKVDEKESEPSGKRSKAKTFFLITIMMAGLGLFTWNMIGFVNNKRLDEQGSATNIVYKLQDLKTSIGGSEGSEATDAAESTESPEPADTKQHKTDSYSDDEMTRLKKEVRDAENEAALVKQELKNAEDMLNSSLAREEELKNKLNGTSNNGQ